MDSPFTTGQEWELQDYLRLLRQEWKLPVLLVFLFGGATALFVKQLPDQYRASACLLLERETPQIVQFQQMTPSNPWDFSFLKTEIEILTRPPLLKAVVEELNLAAFPPFSKAKSPLGVLRKMIEVRLFSETKLVDIIVTGPKPELITRIANTLADIYVRQNLERRQRMTTGGVQWLQEEVTQMEEKVRAAQLGLQTFLEQHSTVDFGEERQNTILQRIQALNGAITDTRKDRIEAETKYREKHPTLLELQAKEKELQVALFEQEQRALEMSRLSIQYNVLLRDVKTSESIYNILLTRLKELSIQEGLQFNNAQVIDYAEVPERPIGPSRRRTVLFATVFGFLLGGGLTLFRETFNKKIRSRQEFELALGIPFLGYLPLLPKPLGRGEASPLFLIKDPVPLHHAESLRALRTTLEFLLPAESPAVLLVTSALPEEGKSVVSTNLAMALRELDRKIILVDADMRHPTVHHLLKLDLEPGLSDYLQEKAGLEEIVKTGAIAPGLPVITAGVTPSQSASLLTHPRMVDLLKALTAEYPYVLLDTPPVLATADTPILSGLMGQVIYVVCAGRTDRDLAFAGKQRLVDVGAKFIGGILNKSRLSMERGYGYYYYDRKKGSPSRKGTRA